MPTPTRQYARAGAGSSASSASRAGTATRFRFITVLLSQDSRWPPVRPDDRAGSDRPHFGVIDRDGSPTLPTSPSSGGSPRRSHRPFISLLRPDLLIRSTGTGKDAQSTFFTPKDGIVQPRAAPGLVCCAPGMWVTSERRTLLPAMRENWGISHPLFGGNSHGYAHYPQTH